MWLLLIRLIYLISFFAKQSIQFYLKRNACLVKDWYPSQPSLIREGVRHTHRFFLKFLPHPNPVLDYSGRRHSAEQKLTKCQVLWEVDVRPPPYGLTPYRKSALLLGEEMRQTCRWYFKAESIVFNTSL